MKIKYFSVLIINLVLLVSIFSLTTINTKGLENSILLTIDDINIRSDDLRYSFVNVSETQDLSILTTNISWDPSIVNLTIVDDELSDFEMVRSNIDYLNGTVEINAIKFGPGLNGDIVAFRLGFKKTNESIDGDTSSLLFSDSIMYDSENELLDHDYSNALVIIGNLDTLIVSCYGPYNGIESNPIQIHGSAIGGVEPYLFSWDLDGDGIFDDSNLQNPTWIWEMKGVYNISLKVTDDIESFVINSTKVTIIKDSSNNNDGSSGSSGGNDGEANNDNSDPIANIWISSDKVYVNEIITFNASESSDEDEDTLSYYWDFDDGTDSDQEKIEHIYSEPGTYVVTLTVDDNNGGKEIKTVSIKVMASPNAPNKPTVEGPNEGSINSILKFTFVSTDPENNNIYYSINWDDGAKGVRNNVTSGMSFNLTHRWDNAGIYLIRVTAKDDQDHMSEENQHKILINTIEIDDFGYLIDNDNDSIYDGFIQLFNEDVNNVIFENGLYFIDYNGDGNWEYKYNTLNSKVEPIEQSQNEAINENKNNLLPIISIILFAIILILFSVIYVYIKIKR